MHVHAKYDCEQLHSLHLMCSRTVALGLVPVLLGLALLFGTIWEVGTIFRLDVSVTKPETAGLTPCASVMLKSFAV